MPAGDIFCNHCNRPQYCCICQPIPKVYGLNDSNLFEKPWKRQSLDRLNRSNLTEDKNIMKEPTLNELIDNVIKPTAFKLIKLSNEGLQNTLTELEKSIDEIIAKKKKVFKDKIDESGHPDESFNKLFEQLFGEIRKSPLKKNPPPQDNSWLWMESWLKAYDKEHDSIRGKIIMDWIKQQPTTY